MYECRCYHWSFHSKGTDMMINATHSAWGCSNCREDSNCNLWRESGQCQFQLGVAVSVTSKSGQWKIKAGSVISSFGIFCDGWADSDGIKLPPKEVSLQQAKQRTFTENLLENQAILGDLLDQQLQSQFLPAGQKDRSLIWRKDTICHDYCSDWP